MTNRRLYAFVSALLLIFCMLHVPPSEARGKSYSAKKGTTPQLYHKVRKGDTVSSIAKKHGLSARDLMELNNLKSSRLRTGRRLLVKNIGPKTYTVRKGDSISKIASMFDMDPDDLMTINDLQSPDLRVGRKLFLEQKPDDVGIGSSGDAPPASIEEEIRKVAESEEFIQQPPQNKLIVFAKKLLDIPYKFGGTTILGIDCSGYVKKVYGLLGVDLPRTAREQFETGEKVDRDDLAVGDLVFFKTYASFPSHVGIYLGNNLFIHASSRGKKVTIDSLETPYYLKRFIGGKRLLTESVHEPAAEG